MANKLQSSNDLQKLLTAFFTVAPSARCRTSADLGAAYSAKQLEHGFNGVPFNAEPELRRLLERIITRSVKLLGADRIHERDIRGIAWTCAAEVDDSDVPTQVKAFLAAVSTAGTAALIFIAPNDLIRFEKGVRDLTIGPVRARITESVAPEIEAPNDFRWKLVVGDDPGLIDRDDDKAFLVSMSEICWEVTVSSSREHVKQQAIWLINIALSLLRLSYPKPYAQPYFPSPPAVEICPIERYTRHGDTIVIDDGYYEVPRSAEFYVYGVTKVVLKHHEAIGFGDRAAKIFAPTPKSVAERW